MLKCHFNTLKSLLLKQEHHQLWDVYTGTYPSSNLDDFKSQLENLVSPLNQSKHQVFILGDMNIDFLRVGTHSKTEDYLDMLYSSNLLPVITKPTRITSHTTTLIDHIYTNASTDQIIPGIVTTDISDHLPTFCSLEDRYQG